MSAFDEYVKRNSKPSKEKKKEVFDEPDELIQNPIKQAFFLIGLCFIFGAIAAAPRILTNSLRFGWEEVPILVILGTLALVSIIAITYTFLGAKIGKRKSERIIKRSLLFTIIGVITYFVATNISKENTPMFCGVGGFFLIIVSAFCFSIINSDDEDDGLGIPILGVFKVFELSMYGMIKGANNPFSYNGFFLLTSFVGTILIIVAFFLV